jgi:hypothetical protein
MPGHASRVPSCHCLPASAEVAAFTVATAAMLFAAACKPGIDRHTAEVVIRRDARTLAVATSREPDLEMELTGYLVNPFEQEKFELMKSLPELFTLASIAKQPARLAFQHMGGHFELLPLARDRSAMVPVPAEPDRMLDHYVFTLSNPALAAEVNAQPAEYDQTVVYLPLRDWEFHQITPNPTLLRFEGRASAHVVVTKRPNEITRLLSRALTMRPPWLAGRLCCLGLGRFPAAATTYSYDINLAYVGGGWGAMRGYK